MTYGFRCASCAHEFEITATVAEYERRGAPACPKCGRTGARRVYTPVMVMTAASRGGAAGGGDPGPSFGAGGGCGCGGACSCGH